MTASQPDYDVRCGMCGWTGDRQEWLSNDTDRCPECNAPSVMPDRTEHPEAYSDNTANSGGSDGQGTLEQWGGAHAE